MEVDAFLNAPINDDDDDDVGAPEADVAMTNNKAEIQQPAADLMEVHISCF